MDIDYDFEVDVDDELPEGLPSCQARHIFVRDGASMGPCGGAAAWICIRQRSINAKWWTRALVCEPFRQQQEARCPDLMVYYPI